MKNRVHIAPNYFFNPTHPITISLIGLGGTGSLLLARLARIDYALRYIGHSGLHVRAFDKDIVEPMNIGRQLFTPNDIGANKAVCAMTKINQTFGLLWEGIPFHASPYGNDIHSNIVITCVDNAKFRTELSKSINDAYRGSEYETMFYWLDIGNSRNTGQFVLGSLFNEERNFKEVEFEPIQSLKSITDFYTNLNEQDNTTQQGEGCSYIEKLNEQSLFINDVLVTHASDCIMRLLMNKEVSIQGGFVNLESGVVNPINV